MNLQELNVSRRLAASVGISEGPLNFAGPSVGVAIALLANMLQIVAVLVQASDQLKTFLFLVSLLIGGAVVLWAANKWPKNRMPTFVFAFGTLTAMALLFWVSASGGRESTETPGVPVLPAYYVRLSAYKYDGEDGALDRDHPIAEIPVLIRDQFRHSVTYKTRLNGTVAILQTFGPILVGACGIFHTHIVSDQNNSANNALPIQIGIDPSRIGACRN